MKERLKQRIDLELNRGQLGYPWRSDDRIEYLNKLSSKLRRSRYSFFRTVFKTIFDNQRLRVR